MTLAECITEGKAYQVCIRIRFMSIKKPVYIKRNTEVEIITSKEYVQGKPRLYCRLVVSQDDNHPEIKKLKFISIDRPNDYYNKRLEYCRIKNQDGTYTTVDIVRISKRPYVEGEKD